MGVYDAYIKAGAPKATNVINGSWQMHSSPAMQASMQSALSDPRVVELLNTLPSYVDPGAYLAEKFRYTGDFNNPTSNINGGMKDALNRFKAQTVTPEAVLKELQGFTQQNAGTDISKYLAKSSYDPQAQFAVTSWEDAIAKGIPITDAGMRKTLTDKLAATPYYKAYPDKIATDVENAQANLLLNNKDALSTYGAIQAYQPTQQGLLSTTKQNTPLSDIFGNMSYAAQQFLRDTTAQAGFQDLVTGLPALTPYTPYQAPALTQNMPAYNAIGQEYGANVNPYAQQQAQQSAQTQQQNPYTYNPNQQYQVNYQNASQQGNPFYSMYPQQQQQANPYAQQQANPYAAMYGQQQQQYNPYMQQQQANPYAAMYGQQQQQYNPYMQQQQANPYAAMYGQQQQQQQQANPYAAMYWQQQQVNPYAAMYGQQQQQYNPYMQQQQANPYAQQQANPYAALYGVSSANSAGQQQYNNHGMNVLSSMNPYISLLARQRVA